MLKQIPNILTIIRFLLIPFIVISIFQGDYISGIVLLTISGATDVLDGFIARKFNLISNFGKLMDPLADKLTQISILTSITLVKIIPVWILVIVVLKELIMVMGASFLYGKDVVVYSKWYGKLATVLFYLAIVISLITIQLNITGVLYYIDLAIYCVALVATVFSLIMYIKCLYKGGFINKDDLNKETQKVVIKNEWKKSEDK